MNWRRAIPRSLSVAAALSILTACGGEQDPVERPEDRSELASGSELKGWAARVTAEVDAVSGLAKRIRRTKDSALMVLIPAGTFQMGAVPGDDLALENELPRHEVTIADPYYVDECHVTVAMWRRYSAEVGLETKVLDPSATESCPMHFLQWTEAAAYAQWAGVEMLSEAQWERAARGGVEGRRFPWGDTDDTSMRNGKGKDDGFEVLAPVKSYPPNVYGLYDISGNIGTWCADVYAPYAGPQPRSRLALSTRAIRGGAFDDDEHGLRVSYRLGLSEENMVRQNGLRCAKTIKK